MLERVQWGSLDDKKVHGEVISVELAGKLPSGVLGKAILWKKPHPRTPENQPPTPSLTAQLPCSHLSDHRSPYFLWKISPSTLHYVVNEGLTRGKSPGIGPDWFKLTGISGLLDTIIGSWMGTWP